MGKGKKHGVEPSLGDTHFRLGLGTPHTFTRSDGSLPDNAQVWVWAESWLVRGISPTQSRQGSMAHVGFPVSGVCLTHFSVLDYSNPTEKQAIILLLCRSHCFLDEAEIQLFFLQQQFPSKAL